jgi:hypothetical protein
MQVNFIHLYKRYSKYCLKCEKFFSSVWKECPECNMSLINSKIPLFIKGFMIFFSFVVVLCAFLWVLPYVRGVISGFM